MLRSFGEDVTDEELRLLLSAAHLHSGQPVSASEASSVDLATFIRMCDPTMWDS
jgi:hypothetical protein